MVDGLTEMFDTDWGAVSVYVGLVTGVGSFDVDTSKVCGPAVELVAPVMVTRMTSFAPVGVLPAFKTTVVPLLEFTPAPMLRFWVTSKTMNVAPVKVPVGPVSVIVSGKVRLPKAPAVNVTVYSTPVAPAAVVEGLTEMFETFAISAAAEGHDREQDQAEASGDSDACEPAGALSARAFRLNSDRVNACRVLSQRYDRYEKFRARVVFSG